MLKKKLGKKITEMESFFEEILVCNDKENRPFLEVFVHEPENITQKDLGALLGIFEINDNSEDSSYIVNYLISVIKKEYFSRPKRGAVESFEAALHKANLALAKLAEYGNINWIGKINALCAVAEKQNLHLTQTGNTLALLLRNGYLTNISEDLSPDNLKPNPLKTFVNISSGKLENQDKLIIITDNILDVLDLEEIKNNALNFSEKDFAQFLRTVLVNKLEKAAALVVDIREKEELVLPVSRKAEKMNVFSNSVFSKPALKRKMAPEVKMEKIPDQFLPPKEKTPKVGHIYIKESAKPEKFEKISSFFLFKKKAYFDQSGSLLQIQAKKVGEKIQPFLKSLKTYPFKEKIIRIGLFFGRLLALIFSFFKDCVVWIINRFFRLFKKSAPAIANIESDFSPGEVSVPSMEKKFRFFPDFYILRKLFARMTGKQKLYALVIIFLIFVVPVFIVKIQKNMEQKKLASQIVETAPVIIPLENEPGLTRLENLNSAVNFSEEIVRLINLKDKIFAFSDKKIFDLENQQEFAIPETFKKIEVASGINDLDLIILINPQGKALAFSPVSKKFQDNILNLPESAKIILAGTYLTYLYLVDSANNQIYRYPRAEGGFGEKINWKKEDFDIARASDIAINENIYLAEPENLLKLFRGKKQDLTIEETPAKILPFKVAAKINGQNIWILDKANSRVVKLDLTGKILAQYYHPEIADSTDFAVNEDTNTVYFSAENTVQSFLAD